MLVAAVLLGAVVVVGSYYFGRGSANVPGSCLVLEERYCDDGERITLPTPWGNPLEAMGFRLPPGAAIFSPSDNLVNSATEGNFWQPDAATITVYSGSDLSATMFQAVGDFALELGAQQASTTTGTLLARMQNTGIRIEGDYDLIVIFAKPDPQESFVADAEMLGRLFP